MSNRYESAELILKLYELRREETMRKARDWFIRFFPESAQDVVDAARGDTGAYYRMVTSYWEMAASFVNHGAIDEQMFNDANGEHLVVFSKIEPFLNEIREISKSPQYLQHLEQLVTRVPDSRERLASMRERMKQIVLDREKAAGEGA